MSDTQQVGDLSAYLAEPNPPEKELKRLFSTSRELTLFDIGACEGEDSVRYARRFPRARIFSFEPLPSNQKLIRENFARHGTVRAEIVPLALADKAGEADFHVSAGQPRELFAGSQWNYGNKSSSLLPPASSAPMHGWIEFKEQIRVRTETLAAFCEARAIRRVDFIHMDVQGAEQLVLAGAGPMLRHVTAIWLEVSDEAVYAGQALRRDIQRTLRAAGFARSLEIMRGTEGDQFYVNLRQLRTWPYLAATFLQRWLGRARFQAGAIKNRLLGGRPSSP